MTIPRQKLFHAMFFTPTSRGWGIPGLLVSKPGEAKTSVVEQVGHMMAAPLAILAPGELGEGAFGAIPVPELTAKGMAVTFPAPHWALNLGDYGLVLVDELTTAPPGIQPALLGLALAGRIGGYTLPARVRILAATNPVSCSANGYDLSAPAANRFVWIEWKVDVSQVTNFWLNGCQTDDTKINAIAEESRVMEAWPSAYRLAAVKVSSFLKAHPDLLNKMPENPSCAWPSARSWEMAIRCLASATIHKLDSEDTDTLVSGSVGNDASCQFFQYLAKMDLPAPETVLDLGTWQPNPRRLDITMTVLSACVALVTPRNAEKRIERATALWQLLDRVGNSGARDCTLKPAGDLLVAGLRAVTPEMMAVAVKVLGEQHLTDCK